MTVPHPLMRQLAAARQQAGLSLDEWSARLGMQLSTVSYLERGISSLSLAALERLAGDLGYEVVLQPTAPTQAATPATGDMDAPESTEGGTGDLSALRASIRDALHAAFPADYHEGLDRFGTCHPCDTRADAVMDAIRPELTAAERHRRQAENRAQLFRDQAAAEHERAEQAERDRGQLKRDIIDVSEEIHDLKNDVARQRKDLKIREIQVRKLRVHRQRYRTAWWSARIRAAKSHAAYVGFHDLLEEANATIGRVRRLHQPHELLHCIGCGISTTYPCDTIRALDAEHTRPCPRCGTPALLPGEADLCPPCETALHRAAPDEPGPDRTTPGALRDLIGAALTTACPDHTHCTRQTTAVIDAILPHTTAIADLYRQAEQDVIALTQRAEAAEAEVARLRAGQSEEPPAPGKPAQAWTHAEWLHDFLDQDAEQRLATIARIYDASDAMCRCAFDKHTARIEQADAELADARAAIDRVRRLCLLTVNCSVRVDAIEHVRDTLAALDRTEPDQNGNQP